MMLPSVPRVHSVIPSSHLVPRLCLGTHCWAGSACGARLTATSRRALAIREAEPLMQCAPRQSLGAREAEPLMPLGPRQSLGARDSSFRVGLYLRPEWVQPHAARAHVL